MLSSSGFSPAPHSATVLMSTVEEGVWVSDEDLLALVEALPAKPEVEAKATTRDFYNAYLYYAMLTGTKTGTAKTYFKHLRPFFRFLKEAGTYDVQTQALNFGMSGPAPYAVIPSPMEYLQVKNKSEHMSLGLSCACKIMYSMCVQLLNSDKAKDCSRGGMVQCSSPLH